MIARTRFGMALPAWVLLLPAAIHLGAILPSTAAAADPAPQQAAAVAAPAGGAARAPLSTFEGVLRIHPKFLYRYYIVGFAEGQHFALFSGENGGEDKLKNIPVGSTIEVRGRLGTRFHAGGTADNQSPFSRAWYVYMEVEQVKVIRGPDPLPKSDKSTPAPVSPPPGAVLPGTVLPGTVLPGTVPNPQAPR
jgi:hypothetical protein